MGLENKRENYKLLDDNALVGRRVEVKEELEKVSKYLESAKKPSSKKRKKGEVLKKELDLLEEECERRILLLDKERDKIISKINNLDNKMSELSWKISELSRDRK